MVDQLLEFPIILIQIILKLQLIPINLIILLIRLILPPRHITQSKSNLHQSKHPLVQMHQRRIPL